MGWVIITIAISGTLSTTTTSSSSSLHASMSRKIHHSIKKYVVFKNRYVVLPSFLWILEKGVILFMKYKWGVSDDQCKNFAFISLSVLSALGRGKAYPALGHLRKYYNVRLLMLQGLNWCTMYDAKWLPMWRASSKRYKKVQMSRNLISSNPNCPDARTSRAG